jgi:hypothetical protein
VDPVPDPLLLRKSVSAGESNPGHRICSQELDGGLQNSLARKIFGTKRDDISGGWREIHNEELHNFAFFDNCTRQ